MTDVDRSHVRFLQQQQQQQQQQQLDMMYVSIKTR